MLVLPGEWGPAEGQGSKSPVVSPASAGRAKGGCLLQGRVEHRDRGEADTGPACSAESTENSSIVGTARRVRWTGRMAHPGHSWPPPQRGGEQEDREGQELLWCLPKGCQVPPASGETPAGKSFLQADPGRSGGQAGHRNQQRRRKSVQVQQLLII